MPEYQLKTYTVTLTVTIYDGYQEHPSEWRWENLLDGLPPTGHTKRESIRLVSCKLKDRG